MQCILLQMLKFWRLVNLGLIARIYKYYVFVMLVCVAWHFLYSCPFDFGCRDQTFEYLK